MKTQFERKIKISIMGILIIIFLLIVAIVIITTDNRIQSKNIDTITRILEEQISYNKEVIIIFNHLEDRLWQLENPNKRIFDIGETPIGENTKLLVELDEDSNITDVEINNLVSEIKFEVKPKDAFIKGECLEYGGLGYWTCVNDEIDKFTLQTNEVYDSALEICEPLKECIKWKEIIQ